MNPADDPSARVESGEEGEEIQTDPFPHGADMPPEEFRLQGHEVVDWIAEYFRAVEDTPVLAQVQPGEIREGIPARAPERGEPMGEILQGFRTSIMPGITHWNHPGFLAYFGISGSGPGVLGEMLSAALNVNAMLWRTSPAATELEEVVAGWVRDLLGLPETMFGIIQDTASNSSLVALAAARHRAYPQVRKAGLFGLPPGRIYASEEAHSSIEKAGIALGLGQEGVRRIPVDGAFRLDVGALESALQEDRSQGIRPVALVATLGTTSTTSCDPVEAMARIASETGTWLHVDAAYGGAGAVLPELQSYFRGWEAADSVVFNPHKWLFTPVDCSLLFTRHRQLLQDTFSLVPEYLRTEEADRTTQLMDYGLALGRRFRALKLWFVLRYFGSEGIRRRIRHHIALANHFARRLEEAPRWRVMAPVPFSTVVFRFVPAGLEEVELDRLNQAILDGVNARGRIFLSHTSLEGRLCLRVAVGNLRTHAGTLENCWTDLQEVALGLLGEWD